MASCYRLPLSASALLLLNFHVFVYALQLHIDFISLQHLDLIKNIYIYKEKTTLTADVSDVLPNDNWGLPPFDFFFGLFFVFLFVFFALLADV